MATGPFLHLNVWHFLANFLGLLLAGPMTAIAISVPRALIAFLVGSVAGAVACYLGSAHEAYAGVSGGVFALFGLLIAAGIGNPTTYPCGLAWQIAFLAAPLGMGAEATANTSTVAHVAGLLSGAFIALSPR